MAIGEQDLRHTLKRRRLGRRRVAALPGDQHMDLAEALHGLQRLGQRIGAKMPVADIGKKKNSHQITPASSFSFAISSSTEPTFTPALRPAGSTVLTTVRRGVTSTP